MQHRMKEFTMTAQAIQDMLERTLVGRISTIGEDGFPYTVAVHFVSIDGKLYFHGLKRGEKLSNIQANNKVCFELDEYVRLMADGLSTPCDADAEYESVVIRGYAHVLTDTEQKRTVLTEVIRKYAPQLAQLEMTEARVRGTAVVEIEPVSITGKYHR